PYCIFDIVLRSAKAQTITDIEKRLRPRTALTVILRSRRIGAAEDLAVSTVLDFHEAYPSFTWRSIWNAHRLLEDGTSWRIENDELTNIWNNAWLPTLGDGKDMTATAGIIIRNHEGLVTGACTYPLGRNGDPTTSKVKTCLQTVIFGEEMGFRDLIAEAAHSLAARGYNLTRQSCWIEEVPTEVEPTVVNDQRRYLSS
ncbi:hypothetical protein Godav_013388, partial [Gossypium davidsonii]|nr:hypothetical protein [Gossypium davidsonii]